MGIIKRSTPVLHGEHGAHGGKIVKSDFLPRRSRRKKRGLFPSLKSIVKVFVGWSEARSPTAEVSDTRHVGLRASLQPTKNRILRHPPMGEGT